jgi:diguanylate cyclase (GGDEF)-like protein
MFMDVSREKAVEQRLVYLANVDRLTGLDNRTFFTHHLDRLLADPAPRKAAVLFIKLDGRKAVNDCYGHAAGDQVLRQVGERLRACL